MAQQTFVLGFESDRRKALQAVQSAPVNARVIIKEPKRTVPQNDKMWAMLTEVSNQLLWHGAKLTPEDWKLVFMSSLKREMRIVPNIDKNGFVNLSVSTSELSREEMSDLFVIIEKFGAEHGVEFKDNAK